MGALEDSLTLIVGLGNPGPQYERTRHNVGFWLLKTLAEKYHGTFKLETKFKGLISAINVTNHKTLLLLPETFMNLSGESVSKVVNFYKLDINSLLIVHDELDFPPGIVRLKKGGSANGHNGVQNIIDHLGTRDFWRIRIGIGRTEHQGNNSDYVLSAPKSTEINEINNAIEHAIAVIPKLLLRDFSSAMSELHRDT